MTSGDSVYVAVDTGLKIYSSWEWPPKNDYKTPQLDPPELKARNINGTRYHDLPREPYEILDLEIDRGCNPTSCWEHPYNTLVGQASGGSDIQLYRYHEVPTFLQGNPHIIHGYRAELPFSLCYKRYETTATG